MRKRLKWVVRRFWRCPRSADTALETKIKSSGNPQTNWKPSPSKSPFLFGENARIVGGMQQRNDANSPSRTPRPTVRRTRVPPPPSCLLCTISISSLAFALITVMGGLYLCSQGQNWGGGLAFFTSLFFVYLAVWTCRYRGALPPNPLLGIMHFYSGKPKR